MRELPRQLSAEELAELFEGRTRLVERLAELEDPLGRADEVLRGLSEEEQIEALRAHPAIGARRLSERSAAEQGADSDPAILSELAHLNEVYEEKFGFRFVVFVNRRAKEEILDVLRERVARGREEELDTGVRELVAIARDPVDPDYLKDVADVGLRLLHAVAGIAWIGASFYFIRLDLGLSPAHERADRDAGVAGEYWGVHGGGFYHSQKYKVAPRVLPEPLHWFKWEAYTTWLSGFALLVLLYWADARTRLVDPAVADLEPWQAVALSGGLLVAGWLVYDVACRLLRDDAPVGVTTALLVVGTAWASSELFAPRAAYLQVGAVLGTIMAANVLVVIIPAHRELVRAKLEGREPDPAPGLRAKQRSVHNNYLTLPVIFTMLAGHWPLTFGSDHAWLVLLAIFTILVVIRHFFNLMHAGRMPLWLLGVAAVGAVALAIVLEPDEQAAGGAAVADERALAIVAERCQSCHSGVSPPLGVRLETLQQLRASASAVERQVRTRAMPLGNATRMTDDERADLVAWAAAAG